GGAAKFLRRLDQVIRGNDDQRRRRIAAGNERRAEADARGRITAARFADDLIALHMRKLPAHLSELRGGRADPDVLRGSKRFDAIQGLLKQGALAAEREELLVPL